MRSGGKGKKIVTLYANSFQDGQDAISPGVTEDTYCRVVGSIRAGQDKKDVVILKITQVPDPLEEDVHELEVAHARLKIRRFKERENAGSGGFSTGFANSSMMEGFSTSKNFFFFNEEICCILTKKINVLIFY